MCSDEDEDDEDDDCIFIAMADIPEEQQAGNVGFTHLSKPKYLVGTQKRTIRDVKFIKDWLTSKGLASDLEDMEPEQLNKMLEIFYQQVRTKDNKCFSRRSLVALRTSLNRFLLSLPTSQYSWISILKNPTFSTSNRVLDDKSAEEKCREKIPKWKPISSHDLMKMMRSQALSIDTAHGLQRKVWLDLTIHFGIKGIKATWALSKNSFILETDENGKQYYCLNPEVRVSKEEMHPEMRDWHWNARMYSVPKSPYCPVHSLSLYLSKLSKICDDFFQRPCDFMSMTYNLDWWYRNPLGHQVISRIMSEISKDAELSTVYTNTCVRATLVQLLGDQGLDVDIMFRSRDRFSYLHTAKQSTNELENNSNHVHSAFYKVCYDSGSSFQN